MAHARPSSGAVEDLAQLLVGEDPTRIEHLWQMMYRQHFWHGHGIVRATAIAGIDLALWDILGKVAGVPCRKLWGGPVRDHVRTYCHLGGGRMEDFYETAADDAEPLRRPRPAGGRRRVHRVQGDGRAADDAARRAEADPRPPRACVARDARGGRRRRSTSWSTATPGRRRRWACSSPRRSSRTASTSSKSRAGRRASTGWRRSTRAVSTPIATGERRDEPARRSATCSTPGPARSASSTSPTAAASPKRGGSRPWPRRTASRSPRTTRKARSARRRRWSSASRSRATSSARRSTPTCRGGRTSCRKGSPSSTQGRIVRPEHAAGPGHRRSTRPR